jgi:hypothetical protein
VAISEDETLPQLSPLARQSPPGRIGSARECRTLGLRLPRSEGGERAERVRRPWHVS